MRKIFIVIERRSDYSRFRPVLFKLKEDPFFRVHLVVTGLCLLERHGKAVDFIRDDGITVNAEIPMFTKARTDSGASMVRAMSRLMYRLTYELEKVKPDLVLIGFDVGASLATAITAAHMNIPVVHLQGGELTGSIDESIRHATSKFAHYHMPATSLSKKRLIQMGENPTNIFVVGCPSIDALLHAPKINIQELEKMFDINIHKPFAIMIQHPVTTECKNSYYQIKETLLALKKLELQSVIILPNNDAGYSKIIREILHSKIRYYPNLSGVVYANLLKHTSVLIGNSSSGIHEAPSFKVPVVNIGTRQRDRERSRNVIDVGYDHEEIIRAVKKALYNKRFIKSLQNITNPYGDGKSTGKIIKILKKLSLDDILQKRFYEHSV